MTLATERLRASDRRGGTSSRGGSTGIPLRGPLWSAAEVSPSGGAGANRDRLRSSLRGQPDVGRMEPDRAETPCLPPTFGSGDAKAVRAARRNVQRELGGAMRAAASETSRSKAQGSIERGLVGKLALTDLDRRGMKDGCTSAAQRGVATRERARLQRREGTPAGERDRVRKDETR
jgi:hypothetical protein